MINILFRIFFITVILVSTGCGDLDPFGMTKKSIVGNYKLHKFKESRENYYLEKKGFKGNCGILDGTISKIGWTNNIILAHKTSCASNDPSGWFTIDVISGRINGPIKKEKIDKDSILSKIKCEPAKLVWDKL